MPAAKLKFAILSTAVLLCFSPLYANEHLSEDREVPAVQDWIRDDSGNGDPPDVSGAESDQPEPPGDSLADRPAGASARDQPADKPKAVTQEVTETTKITVRDGDGTPATVPTDPTEPKVSGVSPKKDAQAPARGKKDRGGETEAAVPDHQGTEISRDDPMDRNGDQRLKDESSQGNKQVEKKAGEETAIGRTGAEASKFRRRMFYGKIGSTGDKVFPSSPGIDRQKEFWILIFTRYTTQQGVIHDGRTAPPIFQDLDMTGMGPRTQNRFIKHRKRQVSMGLKILAEAMRQGSPLTEKQLALKSRMPKDVTAEEVVGYAGNIHFQRGLSDRFREGITRSGALMAMMRETMARYGLPEDLIYLPHVESSFVNNTLSKSGARGIWQFTRATGRRYMRVGYLVDQRLDPVVATRSAARFLRRYHNQLKSWPLTITSYNHGPLGIKRIIRKMGSRDLGMMILDYEGTKFGFASKNFYAEFLAAREVAKNYRRYFGELKMDRPMRYASAKLPYYVFARDAAKALRITLWHLRWMNPALNRSIWRGVKRIPKGYVLRIPVKQDPLRFVAAIPKNARHKRQRPTRVVRVRRGDTLIGIGRRYGIPWRRIALANNLHRGRIRRGQRLLLPLENRRPARIATGAGPSSGWRKTAAITSAQKITAGKNTAGKNTSGKITAGNLSRPSGPPGKNDALRFSDDAGIGVSYLTGTWRRPSSGNHPPTIVAIGGGDAGGQSHGGAHDLALKDFDAKTNIGRIVAVFGESLGHYADWGNIPTRRLRRLNGFSYRRRLRNGEYLLVYLKGVGPEVFNRRRVGFHRRLETTFFAENSITQRRSVEVKRGQSAWKLARKNNVPLWLFFRENPGLVNNPMRIGMQVIVPVFEAVSSR